MKNIKLALDWTPNINHIGFFVAHEKNFYREFGIDIKIINPFDDNYSITPAKKIELNIAEFALCPTETLISYNTKKNKVNLIGVAAILKQDLSAIVVNKNSGINSPKDLDGKTYASFNARYEEHIIKQMIINDGGIGSVNFQYPDKLGIWETIISNKFDSTWIFKNWEGVEAENLNLKFNYFSMKDYQIPYSYSPILVCNKNNLSLKPYIKSFIESTRKGFTYALNNEDESIKILKKYLPSKEKKINLNRAFGLTIPSMSVENDWGKFDFKKVELFLDWLKKFKIEKRALVPEEIFTNNYIET